MPAPPTTAAAVADHQGRSTIGDRARPSTARLGHDQGHRTAAVASGQSRAVGGEATEHPAGADEHGGGRRGAFGAPQRDGEAHEGLVEHRRDTARPRRAPIRPGRGARRRTPLAAPATSLGLGRRRQGEHGQDQAVQQGDDGADHERPLPTRSRSATCERQHHRAEQITDPGEQVLAGEVAGQAVAGQVDAGLPRIPTPSHRSMRREAGRMTASAAERRPAARSRAGSRRSRRAPSDATRRRLTWSAAIVNTPPASPPTVISAEQQAGATRDRARAATPGRRTRRTARNENHLVGQTGRQGGSNQDAPRAGEGPGQASAVVQAQHRGQAHDGHPSPNARTFADASRYAKVTQNEGSEAGGRARSGAVGERPGPARTARRSRPR